VRVGFPGGPRLEWYDRNPILTRLAYISGSVAPHAYTQRAIYTTPTGKKALVSHAFLQAIRDAAPTTASFVTVSLQLAGLRQMHLLGRPDVVGNEIHVDTGFQLLLLAGEAAAVYTEDNSTAGSLRYQETAAIHEFDA